VTELRATLGDITTTKVDAIVNAANSSLLGGGGVDGAIHRAGGPSILAECRQLVADRGRGCPPGDAVVTNAGNLPACWVIHAVGPIWDAEQADDHDRTLAAAYRRSLQEAEKVGARSVAFPNISTGVYGFPMRRAAEVALSAVRGYTTGGTDIEIVVFVCFNRANFDLYTEMGCAS